MIALDAMSPSADTTVSVHHEKLLHAAQQFEALMLSELMKPLGESSAIGSDADEGSGGNPLQSFGLEAMAGALAKSGALGFADRIVRSVERSGS
jgi:Rod binding domain-containing protein